MTKLTFISAVFSMAALTSVSSQASARGAVLKIDGDKIYVDLGTDAGVATGSLLTLFHVISVTHPVSGKRVRDSFPLTKLRVVNAGAKISVAVVPDPFRDRVVVGDEIELASDPVTTVDPWTRPEDPTLVDPYGAEPTRANVAGRKKAIKAAEEKLARISELEAAWAATLGQEPASRLELWRAFLAEHSATPYRPQVEQTIAEIEAFIAATAAPSSEGGAVDLARTRAATLARLIGEMSAGPLVHAKPTRIDEGVPLSLAFLTVAPQHIADAWLYYRKQGQDAYLRRQLVADGDSYLIGEVPADFVRPPGVEYFVEVLDHGEGASPSPAVGTDKAPVRVNVDESAQPKPIDTRGRSRVSLTIDYVDFDGVGSKNKFDQYWYGEIDFLYRFRKKSIYGLRLGFGTMNGTGGPKDVIDEDPTDACLDSTGTVRCRDVAYNYAYTEVEWRVGEFFGIMLRPQWGSAYRDDVTVGQREFFDAFGLRGRLRFGKEDSSNLVIGAAATEQLGRLFEAAFTWDVLEEVPLVFSVQVTDQPVIEDFGVRLLADIGLRKLSWIYPSVRISYQARDIDHAGLSLGGAANFDW